MSSEPQAVIDTSVLVDLFTGADPARLDGAKRIIKAAERSGIEIVLPAIVVAELAGAPAIRGHHLSRDDREQKVAAVRAWLTSSRFSIAEIDARVAVRAAELAYPHQLTGADACVLAVAELWSIPDLYTNDTDLLKVGQKIDGLHVRKPESYPVPAQGELDLDA